MKSTEKRKRSFALGSTVSYYSMLKEFTPFITRYRSQFTKKQIFKIIEECVVMEEEEYYLSLDNLVLLKSTPKARFMPEGKVYLSENRNIMVHWKKQKIVYPPMDMENGTKDTLCVIAYNIYLNKMIEIPLCHLTQDTYWTDYRISEESLPKSWDRHYLFIWTMWKRVDVTQPEVTIANSKTVFQGIYPEKTRKALKIRSVVKKKE